MLDPSFPWVHWPPLHSRGHGRLTRGHHEDMRARQHGAHRTGRSGHGAGAWGRGHWEFPRGGRSKASDGKMWEVWFKKNTFHKWQKVTFFQLKKSRGKDYVWGLLTWMPMNSRCIAATGCKNRAMKKRNDTWCQWKTIQIFQNLFI